MRSEVLHEIARDFFFWKGSNGLREHSMSFCPMHAVVVAKEGQKMQRMAWEASTDVALADDSQKDLYIRSRTPTIWARSDPPSQIVLPIQDYGN
jgi:hypothetical protein